MSVPHVSTSTPSPYYTSSGRFSPIGVVLMFGLAALAGPLLGVVYGYVVAVNPFVYVNFLGTLIAGVGLGYGVGLMAKPGRVRSEPLGAVAGLAAGLAFQYFQWWATLRFYGGEPQLAAPAELWAMVSELAEMEPWALMGGLSPGPVGFKVIWAIEALMIVGLSTLMAMSACAEPYCERCDRFCERADELGPFDFVSDAETLRARVDRGDLSGLTAFERVEVADQRFSRIELMHCPGCRAMRLATVKNVEIEQEKSGKKEEEETVVIGHILVDESTWDRLSKL